MGYVIDNEVNPMTAKRSGPEKPAEPEKEFSRKGPITPNDLESYVGKLQKRMGELKGLRESMLRMNVDKLVLDGKAKFGRGLKLIDEVVEKIDLHLYLRRRQDDEDEV